MSDELVDLLDERGNKTGKTVMKSEAHAKGLWHQGIHVWIYNDKKEVLLQHRCLQKVLFPNLWDISVAGHIGHNEVPEDVAVREAKEEIGLNLNKKLLKKIALINFSVKANNGLINSEFVHIFIYKLHSSPKLVLQKEEVDDAKFFPLKEVISNITSKNTASKSYVLGGEIWLAALELINDKFKN